MLCLCLVAAVAVTAPGLSAAQGAVTPLLTCLRFHVDRGLMVLAGPSLNQEPPGGGWVAWGGIRLGRPDSVIVVQNGEFTVKGGVGRQFRYLVFN